MKCVLDATVFFTDYPVSGECYTTPSVVDELRDLKSKCRFDLLAGAGLRVCPPEAGELERVRAAAERSGDKAVISATDCDVLALAGQLSATLVTDDFAVQNVAAALGIAVQPIQQRAAKAIRWKYRCSGCGRYFKTDGECPVCGAIIKRKLK
ncbi:nucleotide-binding protein [Methanoregula sp.]|uniref:NOB1 family endonuclease n=1 Tax=Methanoregula sp. TaxID=2052170 RepID=UPI002D0937B2|nr:nucleotide-binding protein [Methanoregula sp.]HVP95644.1 nucleotide-binding protein [Methanoregula sp.]